MSAKKRNTGAAEEPVRIFVSYSHENKAWFKWLFPVLTFDDATMVHIWHDTLLEAGNRWDDEIKGALKTMDVFLCLVSFDFLASWYIKNVELPEAVKRAEAGEVEIVPLLLYPLDLRTEQPDLYKCQPLPEFGKCWRDYCRDGGEYRDAHHLIRKGLRDAIERVRQRRRAAGGA